MASNLSSHGRGGAGNMADAKQSPRVKAADLETPTLKKPIVTTGRGGQGNMAKNSDPLETRMRQDVDGIPRRYSSGAQHAGRGGAGNVFKDGSNDEPRSPSADQAIADDTSDDISSKNKKSWLFGKKS